MFAAFLRIEVKQVEKRFADAKIVVLPLGKVNDKSLHRESGLSTSVSDAICNLADYMSVTFTTVSFVIGNENVTASVTKLGNPNDD